MSDEVELTGLRARLSEWAGVRDELVVTETVQRSLARYTADVETHLAHEGVNASDATLMQALGAAVTVGETYFFRHPEQLTALGHLIAQLVATGRTRLRAWSAGCATGEEAYSLAALLRGSLPTDRHVELEVLGTDLVAQRIEVAERAVYGEHSVRVAGPLLFPLFETGGDEQYAIAPQLRALTRFAVHNLLEPASEPGTYDLIVCRNVLVYLTPAAAATVVARLSEALAPGGIIAFGSVELEATPPDLEPAGPPEFAIFRRMTRAPKPAAQERATATVATPSAQLLPVVVRAAPSAAGGMGAAADGGAPVHDSIAVHLRALALIEAGRLQAAAALLDELVRGSPAYVPGLLERALLWQRGGEEACAEALMRELLLRMAQRADDEVVSGPTPLQVVYYRRSAEAFLARRARS